MLYALGEEQRIVGISGFTVRPPRARQEKPRVIAFTSAKIDRILALKPDLAIGFSDMQADIAQALISAGVEVWISQPPLGRAASSATCCGWARWSARPTRTSAYADALRAHVDDVRAAAARAAAPAARVLRGVGRAADQRDPLGQRADRHRRRRRHLSRTRGAPAWAATASSPTRWRSCARAPDMIIGSWCGKKFRPEQVAARAGLGRGARGARRRAARDQVAADPAARPGGADRRARRVACDHRSAGPRATLPRR